MKKTNIFTQLLISTVLPAAFILTLVVYVINDIMVEQNNKSEIQNAENHAYFATNLVENNYERYLHFLSFVSNNVVVNMTSREDIGPLIENALRECINTMPSIYCAWAMLESDDPTHHEKYMIFSENTYFPNGQKLFSENALHDPNVSPRVYIPFSTGNTYFDPMIVYDYGNGEEKNCSVSSPIFDKDGDIIGAIGFDVKYENMFSIIIEAQFSLDRPYGLMMEDGYVFFSSEQSIVRGNFLELSEKAGNDMTSVRTSIFYDNNISVEYASPLSKEEALLFITPLGLEFSSKPLFFFLDVPLRHITGSSNEAVKLVVTTSIFGLILIAASIFFSTRNIAEPIKSLIDSAQKIARGDLNVVFFNESESDKNSKNEIVQLNSALKNMMEQQAQAHLLKVQKIDAEIEKEKAIASSNAKTQFFANMSHEIRTPMNSILGMVQIMLMDDDIDKKQRKYLSDIKVSAESLIHIINDILDLSKLESGKIQFAPLDFNFTQFLANLDSFFGSMAKEKNITFSMVTKGDVPTCLFADEFRIRQVLINIVGNAIKFTSKGGVKLVVASLPDKIQFEVIDTGIGIPPENMTRIFNSFEQFDNVKSNEGTGLGLAICKNLLDLMGGSITVSSIIGQGTTFTVTIPKELGDEKLIASPGKHDKDNSITFSKDVHILIVDDNEINLHVASGLLEVMYSIDCDLALSGAEAIVCVKNNKYDLVFMDHMMPDMDGIETTKHIRSLGAEYEKIPIVALTANAVIGVRNLLLNAGMDDFLTKPIDNSELKRILMKWIPANKMIENSQTYLTDVQEGYLPTIAKASQIAGLDVISGLQNVAEKQSLYEKSLILLKDKIPSILIQLPKYLEDDDIKNFTIQVHGLKSSLASVGATSISKVAARLEKAAKNNQIEYCMESLPMLLIRLGKLGDQLSDIFVQTDIAHQKGGDDEYQVQVQSLIESMQEYNIEALQTNLSEMMGKDYGEKRNEVVRKLSTYVESFDYDSINVFFEDQNNYIF